MAGLPPFIPLPGAPGLGLPGLGLPLPKFGGAPETAPQQNFGNIYDHLQAQQPHQVQQTPALQAPSQSLFDDMPSRRVTAVPNAPTMIGDLGKPLTDFLDSVNNLQLTADQKKEELATGGDVELHDVMLSQEKADLAVDLTMQIRNKLVDAYQEVMRMSV